MENLKRIKKLSIMLSLVMAGLCLNAQAPASGMVGYFSFDALNEEGNVTCDSGTASGNEGTLMGAALTSSSKIGANALEIDPTSGDSYVDFDVDNSAPFVFNTINTMSVALWVKPGRIDHTTSQKFLSINNLCGGVTYYFEISTENELNTFISTEYDDGGEDSFSNAFARSTSNVLEAKDVATWKHVAFTFDGANVKLYIDGVLVKHEDGFDSNYTIVHWSNLLSLGAFRQDDAQKTTDRFKGTIDELYFYNRVLSGTEVLALMQETLGLEELGVSNALRIYPNPAGNTIQISGLDTSVSYKIISTQGKILMSGFTTGNLNISDLESGFYILQIDLKQPAKFVKL